MLIALFSLLSLLCLAQCDTECFFDSGDHWIKRTGSDVCIAVYTAEKTREMAKQDCDARDAVLVKPLTQDENVYLNTQAGNKDVWISLKYDPNVGYVWDDDTMPTTYLWAPLEPYTNSSCVVISQQWYKQWNDIECTVNEAYACQKPPRCRDGWTYFPNDMACIAVYTTEKTREMAKQDCEARNAVLVKPSSQPVNDWLNEKAGQKDVYIGLSDIAREGNFIWDDGTYPTTSLWAPLEPYNHTDNDCVVVSNRWYKQWNDVLCTNTEAYACQKAPICPDHFTFFPETEKCIRVFDTEKNKAMAQQECTALGAVLVKPQTQTLNEWLIKEAGGSKDVWIGLTDVAREGNFIWDDGTSPTTYLWAPLEPYNHTNTDCVTVSVQWYKQWNDVLCTTNAAYACEKAAVV